MDRFFLQETGNDSIQLLTSNLSQPLHHVPLRRWRGGSNQQSNAWLTGHRKWAEPQQSTLTAAAHGCLAALAALGAAAPCWNLVVLPGEQGLDL